MSKFQAYLFVASLNTLLKEHPMCLTNLLLMIPTAAGEQLLETLAFQCPKDRTLAKISSTLFLFLPVVVLILIGVVVDMRFWYVCHGRRNRNERDQGNISSCSIFRATVYRSLAVPGVWLFVALLDGTYVVCLCAEEPDELTESTVFIQAVSQWSAWILLFTMVIIGTTVTCRRRWFDNNTFLKNLYNETYIQKMEEETKQKAIKMAEEAARNYVELSFALQPENGGNQRDNGNNHTGNVTEIDSGIDETASGDNHTDNVTDIDSGINETGRGQRKTNNDFSSVQQKGDNAKTTRVDQRINDMAKPGHSRSSIQQKGDGAKTLRIDQRGDEKVKPLQSGSSIEKKEECAKNDIHTSTV